METKSESKMELKSIKEFIKESKSCAIIVNKELGRDGVSVACALYRIFVGEQKKAVIIYGGDESVADVFKPFCEIKKDFDEGVLNILIDYKATKIEKVSYSTEDGNFKMKVYPVAKDFDTKKISYEVEGEVFDLFITVGISDIEYLNGFKGLNNAKRCSIINIDTNSNNKNYGTLNIVDDSYKSLVQMVFVNIGLWGFTPDEQAVEAMLLGLRR